MRREEILKQFIWGMSILNSYIEFNGKLNLHDINIFAESFMCDLLNIVFGFELINENDSRVNNPGYDLISKKDKCIIQVSSTKEPIKVIDTFATLNSYIEKRKEWSVLLSRIEEEKEQNVYIYTQEVQRRESELINRINNSVDLSGYRVYFMVLTNDASKQREYRGSEKCGYAVPEELKFIQCEDIWDFGFLVRKINSISETRDENRVFEKLINFMEMHNDIFVKRTEELGQGDNVSKIIKEYADNFNEKLFRHRYVENSNVKLCNLYVDPFFKTSTGKTTKNIVKILDDFLWNDSSCRILFVEGDAAIGKTSWVSWLCYHYLELDEIGQAIFLDRKIICIRLRELDFTGDNLSTERCILKYLGVDSLEQFKRKYKNCIMILDGADEISMIRNLMNTSIEEFISMIRQIFNENKIIITSRPKFINIRNFDSKNYLVKNVEILHFDYDMRMEWLRRYEKCGEIISKNTKKYIENMDEQMASGVADTPLALYLLVACDMREELQGNAWALYHEIFRNAIINTEYNENFGMLKNHPIRYNEQMVFDIVCDISFRMFQNSGEERYYVTGQELDDIISKRNLRGDIQEWAKQCCVLCAYWKSGTNLGALEFYHNNIRDYFLCEYLYKRIEECCYSGKRYEIDDDKFINTMCEILAYGNISGTTWEQVFSFFYMRLKYERYHAGNGKTSIMATIDMTESIPRLFCNMTFVKKILWEYKYKIQNYQAIKNTLFNTLLLLRVWSEACRDMDKILLARLWQDEEERISLNSIGFMKEWSSIFKGEVKISDIEYIGVGRNCVLDGIDLENAQLENVNFSNSHLGFSVYRYAHLKNAVFICARLKNANFEGADLRNANFSYADLTDVNFAKANLNGAKFEGAVINNTNFEGVVLQSVDFTGARIENVNWNHQNMTSVIIDNVIFENVELKYAKFRKRILKNIEFNHCDLEKCDFEGATLLDIGVTKSKLSNCKLMGSAIANSRFLETNFGAANLRDSMIEDCYFEGVDATDAAFSQATMVDCEIGCKCNFKRTDFRKTRMSQKQIDVLKNSEADVRWVCLV